MNSELDSGQITFHGEKTKSHASKGTKIEGK